MLEQRLTKQQILTLYVNQTYMGQRGSFSINGFGEAAAAYFGKDISSLTLPEAARLAAIDPGSKRKVLATETSRRSEATAQYRPCNDASIRTQSVTKSTKTARTSESEDHSSQDRCERCALPSRLRSRRTASKLSRRRNHQQRFARIHVARSGFARRSLSKRSRTA